MLSTRLNSRPMTAVTANTTPLVQAATAKVAAKTPVQSPALTDGAVVTSKRAPLTSGFQAFAGPKAGLLSGAAFDGKTPPVPPSTGGGPVAIGSLWDIAAAFLGLGDSTDIEASKGDIIDGILDFIDSLPKPE